MGWCRGSNIAEEVFKKTLRIVQPDKRQKEALAKMIYDIFCNSDADAWDTNMEIMKNIPEEDW